MIQVHRYRGYALNIASEFELPGLPAGDGDPDVVIRLGKVPHSRAQATPDEEFAFNTLAGRFRVRGGREIVVDPLPDTSPEALRVVLLGRMMAFLLRQRGWLPLHASIVEMDRKAVLFLGMSGAGKSTTAAACRARGHDVVADDIGAVRVEQGICIANPALPRLRLLDDSCSLLSGLELRSEFQLDKRTFDLGDETAGGMLPVKRIYLLENGPKLSTEPIPRLEAVSLLSRHSFTRHAKQGPEAMQAHLQACAAVSGAVPLYRLLRPASLAGLSALVELVEMEVSANG